MRSTYNLWDSKVWEPFVSDSYGIDRLRLVTTRVMTAGLEGLWSGYFSKLETRLDGLSFVQHDCHKMFQTVDFCDMFLDLSSKVN